MPHFKLYTSGSKSDCLALFDANCPEFFLLNERAEYREFLEGELTGYEVCESNGKIVGAFGLEPEKEGPPSICWIMIHPGAKGQGIGSAMMQRAEKKARAMGADSIRMGASHLSAPFFARFGALEQNFIEDGWGPGMHRIDMIWNLDRLAG
ncbi:MAG: GNAT family N-acetyltransferase [Pseudomonadota bacterium]